MPWSYSSHRQAAQDHLSTLRPRTALDVGVGAGVWQEMYPAAVWTGIEVWEPYVERFGLKARYRMIVGDATEVDLGGPYDVAILGDVLEHTDNPLALYERVRGVASKVIVQVPLGEWPQGEEEGNPYETHRVTLTAEEVQGWPGVDSFVEKDRIGLMFCSGLAPARRRKVAVYCITKNEEQFITRWADSAAQADYRVVVDTGSTDNTVEAARAAGCIVHGITVSPWRFDDARNASLALLPSDADWCIALDADEVLVQGWRSHMDHIPEGVTRPRYRYVWSWTEDGSPGVTYLGDKVHTRHNYRWVHPVHEVLTTSVPELQHNIGLEIHHHPDPTKSRGQYFPLLELAVKERPNDDRNAHYLAREYFFTGQYEKASAEFQRHLALPTALWAAERARSMLYLSRIPGEDRMKWVFSALAADAGRRENWVELAKYWHEQQNWKQCLAAAEHAINLNTPSLDYMTDPEAWGYLPYDLAALAAWYLERPELAMDYGEEAVKLAPNDERLQRNLLWYRGLLEDM